MAFGGAALLLTPTGRVALRLGGDIVAETAAPMLPREWATVSASFDGATAIVAVAPHAGQSGSQIMQVSSSSGKSHDYCWRLGCILPRVPRVPAIIVRTGGIGPEHRGALGAGDVATVAAALAPDGSAAEHYNGKLASPTLWREALDLSLLSATVSRRIIAGIWVAFFQECQQ